jgi:hypothetical protein
VANIRASFLVTASWHRRIMKPSDWSDRPTVSTTLECLTGNHVLVGGGASIELSSSRLTVLAPQWAIRVEAGDDKGTLLPRRMSERAENPAKNLLRTTGPSAGP